MSNNLIAKDLQNVPRHSPSLAIISHFEGILRHLFRLVFRKKLRDPLTGQSIATGLWVVLKDPLKMVSRMDRAGCDRGPGLAAGHELGSGPQLLTRDRVWLGLPARARGALVSDAQYTTRGWA